MCLTDEYAIIIFKSVNRRQSTPTNTLPIILTEIKILTLSIKIIGENNQIPKLPNFKRIAARSIDPKTGASTWALGNHKWTPYIGSFTKKAANRQKIITLFNIELFKFIILSNKSSLFVIIELYIHKYIPNNGKDALIV